MKNKQLIDTDEFIRPRNYKFLTQLGRVVNLSEVARMAESVENRDTFFSRVRRNTDLTKSLDAKAEAHDVADVLNEMWYIIGVALGKLPEDRKREFKYFKKP